MSRRKYRRRNQDNYATFGFLMLMFLVFSGVCSGLVSLPARQPLLTSFLCGGSLTMFVLVAIVGGQLQKKRTYERLKLDAEHRATRLALNTFETLNPYEFEHAVADMFRFQGYETTVTPKRNDRGIDIYLRKGATLSAVQCKRYQENVSPGDIRDFVGALDAARIKEGFFVTTSGFSRMAHQAAENSSHKIHLINGVTLGKWKRRLVSTPLPPITYNTDLINAAWWGRMTTTQKATIIILWLMVIGTVVTAFLYAGLAVALSGN